MRPIKFRAKIAGTDVWIFGLPYAVYSDNDIDSIQCMETKQVEYIKTDTLGEFTGLLDKNGKEIYEGDIVCWPSFIGGNIYTRVVSYDTCGFNPLSNFFSNDFEIIGNIHEK